MEVRIGKVRIGFVGAAAVAAAAVLAGTAASLPAASAQTQAAPASASGKQKGESKKPVGRVPAALVGSWTWGVANPGRYVSRTTGEYVGHAGGGAVSYEFGADGTFRKYVIIHLGAGFSNESTFSAMEGRVDFNEAAGTFKVNFTKGSITFEKKSGMTKRPLTQEDMERAGTVFNYRHEKDEQGRLFLLVSDRDKPVSEGRQFNKDTAFEQEEGKKGAAAAKKP